MVKKNWENPEIMGLGLQGTKECVETLDDKGMFIHMCNYCGKFFKTHEEEQNHEKTCPYNPSNPPASEGEGPEGFPTPELS